MSANVRLFMDSRPSIAIHWLGSCGGCEETFLDLAEELPRVMDRVRIAFCPMLTDFKVADLDGQPDGSLLAAFISGCVITDEHAEMAALLRRKSRIVVAFGACAHLGGVPGLANQFGLRRVTDAVRADGKRRDVRTGSEPELPSIAQSVRTLDQVIPVDHCLPGCPPTAAMFEAALTAIINAAAGPMGKVLAPDVAVCDECPRKDTRRAETTVAEIRRIPWVEIDPDLCLLNQGILCLGPGTRSGCGAACIRANMPCTGCFGPTSGARDHGGKLISAAAAAIAGEDADAIRKAFAGLADPVGSLYRYSLPGSLLRGRRS